MDCFFSEYVPDGRWYIVGKLPQGAQFSGHPWSFWKGSSFAKAFKEVYLALLDAQDYRRILLSESAASTTLKPRSCWWTDGKGSRRASVEAKAEFKKAPGIHCTAPWQHSLSQGLWSAGAVAFGQRKKKIRDKLMREVRSVVGVPRACGGGEEWWANCYVQHLPPTDSSSVARTLRLEEALHLLPPVLCLPQWTMKNQLFYQLCSQFFLPTAGVVLHLTKHCHYLLLTVRSAAAVQQYALLSLLPYSRAIWRLYSKQAEFCSALSHLLCPTCA